MLSLVLYLLLFWKRPFKKGIGCGDASTELAVTDYATSQVQMGLPVRRRRVGRRMGTGHPVMDIIGGMDTDGRKESNTFMSSP